MPGWRWGGVQLRGGEGREKSHGAKLGSADGLAFSHRRPNTARSLPPFKP